MAQGFSLATTAEPEVARPGLNILTGIFGLMLLGALAVGVYGFFVGHPHVYNNTREVPWGLLISTYAFFAITSTGLCLLAAISHVLGGNRLAPLANRMVWLSLVAIISAFTVIGMEIENPWRMAIYNIISPNFTSNIWWMGTLYGLAVGLMLVEFWFILTRQYKAAIFLGVLGALAEVAANTCLGGVFATLPSRPFWYGGQLPMYFLACAFLSGSAAAVLFTHLSAVIRRRQLDADTFAGVQGAGKIMLLMLILISVATFWKMASFFVGGTEYGRLAGAALYNGPLSTYFWVFEIGIGLAAPILLLVFTRVNNVPAMSLAALMALVGMFVSRLDMVVAGQIVPQFTGLEKELLVYPTEAIKYFPYVPSGFEWIVAFGGIGLCGMGFFLGERFFGKAFADKGH